jgi:transcription elongation factor Elf1
VSKRKAKDPQCNCPECNSGQLIVTTETSYILNTGAHYCHSVKAQDLNAVVQCLDCGWPGARAQIEAEGAK